MSFNQPSPDSANDAWDHLYQTCSPMTREYLRGCPIPNAYHTIFIDGMNFSFHHYVSLKSVHSILKPFAMYIHGYSFPTENLLFQKAVKAFNLTLVPARKAEKAFHIDLQTDEQSDVLRLEINALYGGIYSDLDVFWLKSMTHEEPSLLRGQYEMVLAPRFNKTNHRTSLTNVILVNKRCARFIQDWYKFYTLLADAPRKDFPTVLPQTMWQSLASENSTASDLVHVEVERLQQPDVTLKQFIHTPKGIKSWKWGKSIACNLFYDKYQKNHTFDDIKVVNNPIGRMARYILWGDKTKAFDMNKDYFL
ncbi:hypothetical protein BCR33DRAFT_779988 [Rhizoclosmatium globosum]|uniref:Nucleotide-diphospho-sugar transferase domain-containing protein n=1 Tax=Rhizoclosmatium globosum TaxID=329046 RepID=A0A1Y2CXQ7_9FUNG|nr:hypothetical protein BCR33DRAFT_779988 [Rhizoclosmatium globosum]|eukprot:ORY51813.1 hypothetical protein BCR33DRAFT_779988 [Rhizoclosmatium globosum]